jgi:ornithine cyclodeaminase/alanine dehydrogenase-like protein (mu-crystallin family)
MTLILSNEEIAELLPISDSLARLTETYQEVGEGRALSRPRSDIYGPMQSDGRYIIKSMDGMIPLYDVAATRLCSDVISWEPSPAGVRKEKHPKAPGGRWVGLILLFSIRTGEPLAIMPDGVIQSHRVACTNAIAARHMASDDADVLGLIGAGWQARAQALAMSNVRNLREIRIYSPTPANRERLAKELGAKLNVLVRPVDSAQAAAKDADIVGIATNSVTPVISASMLEAHAHITCIKELEIGEDVLQRSALVVVHTRHDKPANYIIGLGEDPIYDHDPKQGVDGSFKQTRAARASSCVDLTRQPDLGELVTGKVKLPAKGNVTCFINTIGQGLQFAALGSLALEKARARGIGREIPTDWLTESVHN